MQVQQVLAAVAVSDMDRAEAWCAQLLGRGPDARPMDGLLEWHLGAAGALQVVLDAERAGGSLVTLVVDAVPEPESEISSGAEYRQAIDPDGNAFSLVQG